MANHPNRAKLDEIRKLAMTAGFFVRSGSFLKGPDDRLDRWYVGRKGEDYRPDGGGYRTQRQAWQAALELAREAT